jgi:hypothetical protein
MSNLHPALEQGFLTDSDSDGEYVDKRASVVGRRQVLHHACLFLCTDVRTIEARADRRDTVFRSTQDERGACNTKWIVG